MAQKQMRKQDEASTSNSIKRTALDPTGSIGRFYDGYRDRLHNGSAWNNQDNSIKYPQTAECLSKSINKDNDQNFLQLINKPEGLRLSLLLGLAETKGIGSIVSYPYPIGQYTRFFIYSYKYKEEQAPERLKESQKMSKSASTIPSSATHIITGISWGIDIIIILQPPPDNKVVTEIDKILKAICIHFNNNDPSPFQFNDVNEAILEQICDITVYSNVPSCTELTTIQDVCFFISQTKNEAIYRPMVYTLQPISWLFLGYSNANVNISPVPTAEDIEVEQYLAYLSITIINIKISLDSCQIDSACMYLQSEIDKQERQLLQLYDMQQRIIDRLKSWIIDLRKKRSSVSKKNQLFLHPDHQSFEKTAKSLRESVEKFKDKLQSATKLKEQHFEYCDVADLNLNKTNYKKTLAIRLNKRNQYMKVLCTSDELNKKKPTEINLQRKRLTEEHENNENLFLAYADFSNTKIELEDIEILTFNEAQRKQPTNKNKRFSTSSTTNDNINILLLGETGVGKSTFINAFVNYLRYKTFEEAQSNIPVVLIPVSFMITTGHDFEEHLVTFGDNDPTNNEDFEHPGESVTQHCKTYEFHLNEGDEQKQKLCIIDTPGFGDTRGLNQDDLNMQDILQYIENLTHLNAVCFLLKPNTSKLHTFFRLCFMQLLELLGPNAHKNIIFCFTNARSTFYSPGDTAPLIKTMLKSNSYNDVPFKKENTFCFDNESFRYLVSLKNGIKFDDDAVYDYQKSWSYSVNESNRLIGYIRKNLIDCQIHHECKSIKRAEIEITRMIRPMLETIHNSLRDHVLFQMKVKNKSLKMIPKAIHRSASICLKCKPYPLLVGKCWVARNIPHECLKKCLTCSCADTEHIPIFYVINYEVSNKLITMKQNNMIVDLVNQLYIAGAEFDFFLEHIAKSLKKDSFICGLNRIIDEESYICESQPSNHVNVCLVENLKQRKSQYAKRIEDLLLKKNSIDLSTINERISTISKIPLIEEQMNIIKQTQESMAELYEVS